MSEDVKPKQFWAYNTNDFRFHTRITPPTTDYDKIAFTAFIELEPTMCLMDELAKTLEFYLDIKPFPDDGAKAFLALEKYKKFKEALK